MEHGWFLKLKTNGLAINRRFLKIFGAKEKCNLTYIKKNVIEPNSKVIIRKTVTLHYMN